MAEPVAPAGARLPRFPATFDRERVTTPEPSCVAILLCTYNGQNHLPEQLASYCAQTHTRWSVFASDDGSMDATRHILDACAERWGSRLMVVDGPRQGFAANFLSLASAPDIRADYYAYSDQDDIWEPDKLQQAVHALQQIPPDVPALYCSRLRLIGNGGEELGLSRLFGGPASFSNALVQNVASGNTSVFNHAAKRLLEKAGADVCVPFHDWWTYMVVSGCGGVVVYDPHPTVRYRQHGGNAMGSNRSWRGRAERVRMLWEGRFRDWNDLNIRALERLDDFLAEEVRHTLRLYAASRKKSFLPRLLGLKRAGIHFQTMGGNLGLMMAAICNKV
ncbi:glycosyltransferase [Pigmentiphaga humi]|uniref:glycosyltransferase n=1 Tax=Pigmentiphaga humi TaxID=2478468 RepID=UPI001FE797B9|nr:glycosyltransferase [Pigmentiphaga humi]